MEKVHAVVARSTFPSEDVQNTPCSDQFWKLRCRKSARCCGAKHISKSKHTKHHMFGPVLEVEMSKTCMPFRSQNVKITTCSRRFGRSGVVPRGMRKGLCTVTKKISKTRGFCSMSKNDGRSGTFQQDLQRCIFRGRRSARDMLITAVRRSGR